MNEKTLKRSRLLYVIEAALEYFISILVAGTFLATLTNDLGFDTATTGVISSIISLGCVFQLIAMFVFRGRVKSAVVTLSVLNQLLFTLLYVIPLFDADTAIKQGVFVGTIFVAYFIYYIAHPAKISWLMSLVDDGKRGRFTAAKEVVSLITGTAFTFAMGFVIDYFEEKQDLRSAFIVIAIGMGVLMLIHTLTMVFTAEKPTQGAEKLSFKDTFKVLGDKNVIKVTLTFTLWYIANSVTTPFYGAFQRDIDGLNFPMWFISILAAVYAIARSAFSYVWGAYADKRSFASMIRICFAIAGVAFTFNVFCVPSNGWVIYTIYYIFYAVAMAGINSALTNLCFDYVGEERRRSALAVSQAVAGLAGFLTTIAISPLVSFIESNGNMLFGIHLYPTQLTSLIAAFFTIVCIVYVSIFMAKKRTPCQGKEPQNQTQVQVK
ncbi:MAG: MFS transporter [Clostridia bacterium]|nr:MFS transporter [Clostridia bacterium]